MFARCSASAESDAESDRSGRLSASRKFRDTPFENQGFAMRAFGETCASASTVTAGHRVPHNDWLRKDRPMLPAICRYAALRATAPNKMEETVVPARSRHTGTRPATCSLTVSKAASSQRGAHHGQADGCIAHSPGLPRVVRVGTLQPCTGWRADGGISRPTPAQRRPRIDSVALGWLIVFDVQHADRSARRSGVRLPAGGAGIGADFTSCRGCAPPAACHFDASLDGALRTEVACAPGLLLAILAVAWVLISRLLFVQALAAPCRRFAKLLPDHHRLGLYEFFAIYLSTGAVFAVLAFIVSAMSAPMIFDRAAGTRTAILTASRQSAPTIGDDRMGGTDRGLTAIGSLLAVRAGNRLACGGHATWHAYRDLIR